METILWIIFTIASVPLAYATFMQLYFIAYPEDEELFKKNQENEK